MNTNKILIAGVVTGVFAFLLGWLIWGILLKDTMPQGPAGFMRPDSEMVMWAMVVSCIAFGLLYAYIYVHWANISTWLSGLKAGGVLGLLYSMSMTTGMYAMSHMYSGMNEMIMDLVGNTVYSAITGAFLGWWLGWRK